MISPKTPQQLADLIETVVASYLDEVRRTVQHAVERSLSRSAATTRPNKSKVDRSDQRRSTKTRRSAGALDELCDKLHQCVCARPGESSAVFADELGCTVRDLQRPMANVRNPYARWDAFINTAAPDALSRELKRRGFKFCGSTIVYAHMQACGLVNDHLVDCFRYRGVE